MKVNVIKIKFMNNKVLAQILFIRIIKVVLN